MIIDLLWVHTAGRLAIKPRTYHKVAARRYLSQAKKKNASRAALRKTMRYLLNCVERNLGHIGRMLDLIDGQAFPLAHCWQRQLWVIHPLYGQQRQMYAENSRHCADRIVSIPQPHVRPILRGKTGKRVEFGAKLGLSLFGGYLSHQTINWDAYSEGGDLQAQAETYRLLTGRYPKLIQCDKIYHTNDNRRWCSERGIRMTAAPKGPNQRKRPIRRENNAKSTPNATTLRGALAMPSKGFRLIRSRPNSVILPRPGSQPPCLRVTFRLSLPSQV